MKKIFLSFFAILGGIAGFAQRTAVPATFHASPVLTSMHDISATGRTTAIGDTETISLIHASDTLTVYTYGPGNGYTTGTNVYGDRGFAERFDYNSNDSSIRVLGLMAQFTGTVNPSSANKVNFHVWNTTGNIPLTSTTAYVGFPTNVIDTLTVPFTSLGIHPGGDTLKVFMFDSATGKLNYPFFVGYDMDYDFTSLAGDTIGLMSTKDGVRYTPAYMAFMAVNDFGDTATDTVLVVQNVTQWSDNTWHDNYTDNDSVFNHLAIFPIVAVGAPTGVNGITRNNLTMFGAYPNPAMSATNIRFSLSKSDHATLQLMDLTGRQVKSIDMPGLSAGEHIIPLNLSDVAAGEYLYLVRTASGDGIAGKLTVIK